MYYVSKKLWRVGRLKKTYSWKKVNRRHRLYLRRKLRKKRIYLKKKMFRKRFSKNSAKHRYKKTVMFRRIQVSFLNYKRIKFKRVKEQKYSSKALLVLDSIKRFFWKKYVSWMVKKRKYFRGPKPRRWYYSYKRLYKNIRQFFRYRHYRFRNVRFLLLKRCIFNLFRYKKTFFKRGKAYLSSFVSVFESRILNILWRWNIVPTISIIKYLISVGFICVDNKPIWNLNVVLYPFQVVMFRFWCLKNFFLKIFFQKTRYLYVLKSCRASKISALAMFNYSTNDNDFFKYPIRKRIVKKFRKFWTFRYFYYSLRLCRLILLRLPVIRDFSNLFFFKKSIFFFRLFIQKL